MAYVDVVFKSEAALPAGRAEIVRRVGALRPRLPAAVHIQVGPEASATGWVLQYALRPPEKKQPMPMGEAKHRGPGAQIRPLREFQDKVLRPALVGIPGVAEVATLGGEREEVVVQTTDAELRAAGAAFSDVATALRARLDRAPRPTAPHDLEHDPVLGKLTRVSVQPAMSGGAADVNGVWPIVVGIVIAKRGADPTAVIARVKEVIERERKGLPPEARLGVLYDRSELAGRVEKTLLRAVAEEIAVVALVVLMFLLHGRSALVPLVTLPLVVLLTFAAMRLLGIPATVMSLGGIAIALGMAVDAELVALEACHRRLETDPGGGTAGASSWRRRRLVAAAGAFAPAILTSLVIAALAFVPVFAFGGETGRLLRPLALTKTLVILLAAVVTLTVAPALRDRLLRGRIVPELGNPLTRTLVRVYRPFVHFALSRPDAHAGDRRAGGAVVPADRLAPRQRVPAAPRRRRSLLHAHHRAGPQPRRRPVRAGDAEPPHRQASRDRRRVRQDRPRRDRDRSGAAVDGGDDDPAQAARRVAARRAAALVFELGAPPRQARAGPGLAREPADDDRRAGRQPRQDDARSRAGRTPGRRRCARAST